MSDKQNNKEYQICNRCVMDKTAHEIVFDKNGNCNFCNEFVENIKNNHSFSDFELTQKREELIERIKKEGKNKPYDCIVGISGGVDSSYVLYLAKQYGLRPLAIHLDNGWNTELANKNMKNLVEKLGVDLYTQVVNYEENKDLQLSFFAANVVDIEVITDNVMATMNYKQAAKHKVKYILGGTNTSTEGMRMPKNWNHYKFDKKNVLSIHKKFGKIKIKKQQLFSTKKYLWNQYIIKRKWINFLDYFYYNKNEALNILIKDCNYIPYPYKHYESAFTRFYQGYILPKKFNIDKRRLHFSTLIITSQMERHEALKLLECDPYPDSEQKRQDKESVMEKLEFTEESFDDYIKSSGVPHEHYGSEKWEMDLLIQLNKIKKRIYK